MGSVGRFVCRTDPGAFPISRVSWTAVKGVNAFAASALKARSGAGR